MWQGRPRWRVTAEEAVAGHSGGGGGGGTWRGRLRRRRVAEEVAVAQVATVTAQAMEAAQLMVTHGGGARETPQRPVVAQAGSILLFTHIILLLMH